jgi:hypothetical protein
MLEDVSTSGHSPSVSGLLIFWELYVRLIALKDICVFIGSMTQSENSPANFSLC